MDGYLNIQSQFCSKCNQSIKDIILPRKRYEKRNKQINIYRNRMESRRFGKEIKDINNLTENNNQSISHISKISELLSKINKDVDKAINKENICLESKIPHINGAIRNQKMTSLIRVNINTTQSINNLITNYNNNNNNNNNRSSKNSINENRFKNIDKQKFNSLKDINLNSSLNQTRTNRNYSILRKLRNNSTQTQTEDSNNINTKKNIDDFRRIVNIKKVKDKENKENYNTINIPNNNNNNSHIKKKNYEKRTQKNETYIMRFIRRQYNLQKEKEKNKKNTNLSLNYRQRSKNIDDSQNDDINDYTKKSQLNVPRRTDNSIPINKKTTSRIFNYKSNNLFVINQVNQANDNPQMPKEYINDIYNHLKKIECEDLPVKNYMTKVQTDINEKMRLILLDWLVEVHIKYNLLNETLFITINLIDKYLSKKSIHRKYLQLLGITALLIACKYEEIYPPKLRQLVYMTDNAYSNYEVLKMENEILCLINFNVSFPTSYKFLEIFNYKMNLEEKDFFRCLYFIEVCLCEYKLSWVSPSLIAATCLLFNFKSKNYNNDKLKYKESNIINITGYSKSDMNECFCCLNDALKKLEDINNKYDSIRRKFKLDKYFNVGEKKYFNADMNMNKK